MRKNHLKFSKVDETRVGEVAEVAANQAEEHVERECADHGAEENLPGKLLIPEASAFF